MASQRAIKDARILAVGQLDACRVIETPKNEEVGRLLVECMRANLYAEVYGEPNNNDESTLEKISSVMTWEATLKGVVKRFKMISREFKRFGYLTNENILFFVGDGMEENELTLE